MALTEMETAADQTFDATSENAQSGIAINNAMQNLVFKYYVPANTTKKLNTSGHIFVFIAASATSYGLYFGSNGGGDITAIYPLSGGVTLSRSNNILTIQNTMGWGSYYWILSTSKPYEVTT